MTHYEEAVRLLDRADHIANSDTWPSERRAQDVANKLAEAHVQATLALAEATNAVAKSNYDGRI